MKISQHIEALFSTQIEYSLHRRILFAALLRCGFGRIPDSQKPAGDRRDQRLLKYPYFDFPADVITDELTFSAYGDGAKPVISGSDPNALLPENWQVYGETADGGIVWLYEQAQTDVSHIIYDRGTKAAIRYAPNIRDNVYINEASETFEPTRDLKEDLSFFSESDLSNWNLQQTLADEYHPSRLFFRCDDGNPAEVLPTLQLVYTLMGVANEYCGTVIDNLDIQSFGSLAVSGGSGWCSGITDEYSLVPSLLVQNCEISFCGGNISNYSFTDGVWSPGSSGGGIQLSGNGNRAINNYIHDVDSKVFILAHHGNYDEQGLGYEGIKIRGNLLTNNCCALHLTDYGYSMTGCEDACYFDVEFTDNAVLYTGYGWFRARNRTINEYPHNHDMCTMDICGISHEKDQIILKNNLFYGAELMLIATTSNRGHPDVTGPLELKHVQFAGNTYAQYGYLGRIAEDVYLGDLEAFVKTVLKDETGTTMLQE